MDISRPAYSYIRFSSEQQKLGDSLRRQLALAEEYAARHDLTLDTQTYRDMGISAYKGKNAVAGKLATFLHGVDLGIIPNDAILLVESLDRLSRNDVDDALELFLSIVRRGLTIVTLTDNQEYCTESIKRDRGISLIISITVMMRAHEESATKSARIRASWKMRTARGGILTKLCPAWIRWVDGKWVIDKERAKVVRRVYRLYLGGLGCVTIQRKLNEEHVPTFRSARYWSAGLVTRLLNNTAVYGTMGREASGGEAPIDNYYPPIVSRADFDRARILAKSRSWRDGAGSKRPTNFFIGNSFCGACGERVRYVTGSGETYSLQCCRAYNHAGCSARRISGTSAERAVIQHLVDAEPLERARHPHVESARAAIVELEASVRIQRKARRSLIDRAIARNEPSAPEAQVTAIERKLLELQAQITKHRRTASPSYLQDLSDARAICAALTNSVDRMPDPDRKTLRLRLRDLIARIFERIEFDPVEPQVSLGYISGPVVIVPTPQVAIGFQASNQCGALRHDRTVTSHRSSSTAYA